MGITINRKTKGRVKLTKPITKILNEWKLDFETSASMASSQLKDEIIRERDFIGKILASNELNIIDVINLNLIVEKNIIKLTPPQSVLNQFDSIFGNQSMINATNSLANEAKVVKKFINKHFTFSFHP